MDYKITNIKISVKCKNICLDTVREYLCDNSIPYKKYDNYIVTKIKYTYIIFKKNIKNIEEIFHVNITNIPTLDYLSDAINVLRKCDNNITILSYSIDNITASKDFHRSVDIQKLLQNITKDIRATYNSETFPGIFLKYPDKFGTAILFHTGKCVLLGSKKIIHIESILESLTDMLKNGCM
jgi:hypothetical protein